MGAGEVSNIGLSGGVVKPDIVSRVSDVSHGNKSGGGRREIFNIGYGKWRVGALNCTGLASTGESAVTYAFVYSKWGTVGIVKGSEMRGAGFAACRVEKRL